MIFDFHTHCFPDKIAAGAVGKLSAVCGQVPLTNGTFGDLREKMAGWSIDGFCCLNIATAPTQQKNVNRFAQEQSAHPMVFGLGSVHPDAPDALTELREIKATGLPGVKLHPDYQGVFADDEKLFPIYEACAALGLFCVFHAGFDPLSPDLIHVTPDRAKRVLQNFPALTVILAHMGGFACWEEVELSLAGERVYLDTSLSPGNLDPALAARIIQKHGAEQVLFGSDCPWGNPADTVRYVETLPLTAAEKDLIFYQNAQRLLGW